MFLMSCIIGIQGSSTLTESFEYKVVQPVPEKTRLEMDI